MEKFIVTAALPYANGPIHIGHIAGAYLPADIFVRYQKLKKNDVVFICGSDEHGAAITLRAKKENKSPKEIIDLYHSKNKKSFELLNIHFSIFDRTSSKLHHETAQDFLKILILKTYLIKKQLNNSLIKNIINFWLIDIFKEYVQNVVITTLTEISVNHAAQL